MPPVEPPKGPNESLQPGTENLTPSIGPARIDKSADQQIAEGEAADRAKGQPNT